MQKCILLALACSGSPAQEVRIDCQSVLLIADDEISTPSVCINPLYASKDTPSTAASEDLHTVQYTPATRARPQWMQEETNTGQVETQQPTKASAATPLVSATGATKLFYPAAERIQQQVKDISVPEGSTAADGSQGQTDASVPGHFLAEGSHEQPGHSSNTADALAALDIADSTASVPEAAQTPSPAQLHADDEQLFRSFSPASPSAAASTAGADTAAVEEPESCAPRRAYPKTPLSAVRRSRISEIDEPTPIRNPMRIPTPARCEPELYL